MWFSPGQSLILHFFDSVNSPRLSQLAPPFSGLGLVQARSRYCTPSPQVAEHSAYSLHSDKPPSISVGKITFS